MPNTTNFGWPTPADTDLVKDGAAAIRDLGSGVDTSLIDLLGGTTGQVLAKASGTDLDFQFVTPSTSPLTTKGDLFTFDTAAARLAVGTNGQVLTADSGEATGLKFATPAAAGGMTLLSTTAMNGVASITLSNINQGFKDLVVLINNVTNDTSGTEIRLLFNNANTACGTGRYGASTGTFTGDNLKFTLASNVSHTVAQTHYCLIKNYASTTAFKPFSVSGTAQTGVESPRGTVIGGAARTTSAITSLVITNAHSLNFNAGEILLFGAN